uniref:Uncharacterized protein LOC111125141 n=1 Tax=Crassostrea virginica TaxID=6565 RepID=A0A8B8DBN2_CRAVI|nr:uncharacterized protein LOC111125141 [Crassostrea virginica]
MAENGGFINVNVTLPSGKLVTVNVSPELYGHFTSSDPATKQLAKQLIIQGAMEQDTENETENEELPDLLPVPTVPPNSPNQNQNQLFTYEQTIFIISGYKERKAKFLSPTHKKKALWSEITENLNKAFAANFSVAQVEGRWKTQLSAFKRHQADQGRSGNERKDFPYEEEFQDILNDRHDINPKFVVSSLSSDSGSSSNTGEPCTSSGSGDPDIDAPQPKRKRKTSSSRTNLSQVIHFLEDYVENQNKKNDENMKKIEKMHKEKMEIFSGFLSVLRNMKD